MTKEVLVTVTGFQYIDDENGAEPVEIVTPGKYYEKNGRHYLFYEESMEGFEEVAHNRIRFTNDRVEVRKSGLINVEMIFEKEHHTVSTYQTPLGSFEAGVSATDIRVEVGEDKVEINVDYGLSLDQGMMDDCVVHITAVPRITENDSVFQKIHA